jgi:hypothetical protein
VNKHLPPLLVPGVFNFKKAMEEKLPETTSQDSEIIEFKIPLSVLESCKLTAEQKLIWLIANKLNEKHKEYDVEILEHFLCISKHRIYKLVNDMIRDGYLKKTTTITEVKDKVFSEKTTTSYLIALAPTFCVQEEEDDNQDYFAPF